MSSINIPAPATAGEAYDQENPTRNTEELSRYLLDLFAAMADKGFILDDGQTEAGSTEDYALQQLWNTQENMIRSQVSRFEQIQGLLNTKASALPTESAISSLVDSAIEGGAELLIGWVLEKVAVSTVGAMAGGITVPLVMAGIETLKSHYGDGQSLLDGLIQGAQSLLFGLDTSRENLSFRQLLIDQNEAALGNYISEMMALEGHVGGVGAQENSELAQINESILILARQESSVMCPHTGDYIYRKSLHRG